MSIVKPPYGTLVNTSRSISQGLIGSWLFNEGSGLIANDSSGNGNHGTLVGFADPMTPTSGWTTGPDGLSLTTSYPTGGYINCGTVLPNLLGTVSTFTFLVRYKATTWGDYGLVSIGDLGGAYGKIDIVRDGSAQYRIMLNGATGIGENSMTETTSMHTFVHTYDTDSKFRYYRDGSQIGLANLYSTPIDLTGKTLYLGVYYSTQYTANGLISAMMIWNRALNFTEISILNNSPFDPYVPPTKGRLPIKIF